MFDFSPYSLTLDVHARKKLLFVFVLLDLRPLPFFSKKFLISLYFGLWQKWECWLYKYKVRSLMMNGVVIFGKNFNIRSSQVTSLSTFISKRLDCRYTKTLEFHCSFSSKNERKKTLEWVFIVLFFCITASKEWKWAPGIYFL